MALKEKINFWLDVLVRPDDISSDPTEIISKSDKISGNVKKELTKKLDVEKRHDKENVVVIHPIVEKVVQSCVKNESKAKVSRETEKDDELEL